MNPMPTYVAKQMIAARRGEMIREASQWQIAAETRRTRRAERKVRREARRAAAAITEPKPTTAPATTPIATQAS